jgi:hypothetical protein
MTVSRRDTPDVPTLDFFCLLCACGSSIGAVQAGCCIAKWPTWRRGACDPGAADGKVASRARGGAPPICPTAPPPAAAGANWSQPPPPQPGASVSLSLLVALPVRVLPVAPAWSAGCLSHLVCYAANLTQCRSLQQVTAIIDSLFVGEKINPKYFLLLGTIFCSLEAHGNLLIVSITKLINL